MTTACMILTGGGRVCHEPAHVVLFAATPGLFAGVMYATGDKILACLEHGGQIYDAMNGNRQPATRVNMPTWLRDSIHNLPAVRLRWHRAPEPARPARTGPNRPTRTGTWKR